VARRPSVVRPVGLLEARRTPGELTDRLEAYRTLREQTN
jgi:hypothetical protein